MIIVPGHGQELTTGQLRFSNVQDHILRERISDPSIRLSIFKDIVFCFLYILTHYTSICQSSVCSHSKCCLPHLRFKVPGAVRSWSLTILWHPLLTFAYICEISNRRSMAQTRCQSAYDTRGLRESAL